MIHVSELAHGYVKTPGEIVKEGDEIEAKVLNVDRKKKQIKLSMKALAAEVEEFKPAAREEKKQRGKRGPKREEVEAVEPQEPMEPELTPMQIAWQEALSKSSSDKSFKVKRSKSGISAEQEEIIHRTLEKRLPTGG
jgi:ribosomal protein S1